MINFALACTTLLWCAPNLPATEDYASLSHVSAPQSPKAAPQNADAAINQSGGGLSGGTPEPGTILLLSGGALAYAGVRARRRRALKLETEDENR